MFYVSVIVTK